MLSIFCCCRVQGNVTQHLKRLLDSLVSQSTPEERSKIEVLIKFDWDDQEFNNIVFHHYDFTIKTFGASRAEGRNSLHTFYDFLFGRINNSSKFVMIIADDFVFSRAGFISEILEIKDEICMVEAVIEPTQIAPYVGRWREPAIMHQWKCHNNMSAPIFSRKFIEITSGFGYTADVDAWAMLLSILLMEDYRMLIRRQVEPFFVRVTDDIGIPSPPYSNTSWLTDFNKEQWCHLTRRQARNLYLNKMHGSNFVR